MKILGLMVGVLLMAGVCQAATFQWDVSTNADGYIMYYTDQTNTYNYNVGNQMTCDMALLNLVPGIEYIFHVTAYNEVGESGPSNEVIYTRESYSPPVNALPVVQEAPSDPSGLQSL